MIFDFTKNLSAFKEKFNLKSTLLFISWSALIFFLGMWSGFHSPSDREASYRAYGILLEKENHSLNKKLNLCKSRLTMIKLKHDEAITNQKED